jgi:TonB family protein
MKQIDEGGGIPRGKFQTLARVSVDAQGAIVDSRIIGSSGNHKMDEAVQQSLEGVKISEPPPDGMPRTMNIRISSQS